MKEQKKIIKQFAYKLKHLLNCQCFINIRIYKIMSSYVDEDTTTYEHHDIGKQVLNHLKTYSFFVYYEKSHIGGEANMMNLDRISFKLKDDKNQYNQKYGDNAKNIQLSFFNMQNEIQLSASLHDLKVTAQQTKTKLVFFSSQSSVANFYLKAKALNINIENIPICIYTSGIHCDFSKFLGWGLPGINNLSGLSVLQIQRDVRKWVQSPTQKIDIWSAEIKVSQEGGSIEKLNQDNGGLIPHKSHILKQLFLSGLSIGYHSSLLLDYQQRKSSNKQPSVLDKIMYSFQGLKKFCCVGNSDMREATGIVKIDFVDEKGEHQIMKYLRDPEQEDTEFIQSNKQKNNNRKNVLSILFSNIDRFFGEKIKGNFGSKMNDQKLELISFQSISESTIITSIGGQINMQLSPDHPVFLQVNDSCYRLVRPLTVKIQSFGKARIIINKETLCC